MEIAAKASLFAISLFFLLKGIESSYDESSRKKMFVFGDSYADTGNLGRVLGRNYARSWFEPYGMTFPKKPTGRFSNGRLLTDYVASFMRTKSPIPYKIRRYGPTLLPYGMNFAVAGSGIFDTGNHQSNLSAQIDHFQSQIDAGVYSDASIRCSAALVVISGNDYAHLAEQDPNFSLHIREFMQKLFAQLKVDLLRLQEIGVPKVMVTNLHPIECTPLYTRASNYTLCPQNISHAVFEHNQSMNKLMLDLRRTNNSNTEFLNLNVNKAFSNIIHQVKGSTKKKYPLLPCCESSSEKTECGYLDDKGNKMYSVCQRPDEHFYWDSVHPTQAGWAAAFEYLKPTIKRFL
ncbi:GDSL esterase/lipase At5g03610-like [Curcuma longa]|uniref:GDSL esterase/lipase At5g03610-like n=1 Tax=Curcuma longa TaxID=136217 RepID=UPI003D9E2773